MVLSFLLLKIPLDALLFCPKSPVDPEALVFPPNNPPVVPVLAVFPPNKPPGAPVLFALEVLPPKRPPVVGAAGFAPKRPPDALLMLLLFWAPNIPPGCVVVFVAGAPNAGLFALPKSPPEVVFDDAVLFAPNNPPLVFVFVVFKPNAGVEEEPNALVVVGFEPNIELVFCVLLALLFWPKSPPDVVFCAG